MGIQITMIGLGQIGASIGLALESRAKPKNWGLSIMPN